MPGLGMGGFRPLPWSVESAPANRELMVPREIAMVVQNLTALDEQLSVLQQRLAPMTSPSGPQPVEKDTESHAGVVLVDELHEIGRRVALAADRVRGLLSRLEV